MLQQQDQQPPGCLRRPTWDESTTLFVACLSLAISCYKWTREAVHDSTDRWNRLHGICVLLQCYVLLFKAVTAFRLQPSLPLVAGLVEAVAARSLRKQEELPSRRSRAVADCR